MTVSFRIRGGQKPSYRYTVGNNLSTTSDTTGSYDVGYIVEKLTSEKHIFANRPHKLSKWEKRYLQYYGKRDFGGPFSVQRRAAQVAPAFIQYASSNPSHVGSWWDFRGYLVPSKAPLGLPAPSSVPPLISVPLMRGKGIEGWNKWKPTATQVNTGQALGELRAIGGLPVSPKMIQELRELGRVLRHPLQTLRHATRTGIPGHDALRYAGSGYLGYQFGIKPYVQDIMATTKAVLDFDKNLRQLVRDNGRPVRRKGRVSLTETSNTVHTQSSTLGGMCRPSLATQLHDGIQQMDVTTSISLEFWFSGRFRYHLDPFREHGLGPIPDREKYQLQRILYGIDPTDVTLIWELMPWSWLIDWIVPIGPMINNLVNDQTDRLVADYAYIMGKSLSTEATVVRGKLKNSGPFTSTCFVYDEVKQRAVASPYGFGVSFTGFSPKQLAILAALGVSR